VTGIRLNQLGREARGLVPFDARQATLKRLSEHVLDLVDVETGRSAVRGVVRADDLAGNFADDGLADLLVEWDDHGRGHAMYSPALGLIPGSITTARSGDHREGGGLMVVRGTGITSQQLSGVAPEDLAPTIAALCGVSLTGIDGQPVDALLSRHAPASVSTPR
jgi:predicted AlkP superfamily phosphohydrolase/phosphomutase